MADYRADKTRRLSPAVNIHYDEGDTFRIMVDDRCYGCTNSENDAFEIANRAAETHLLVFVDLLCPELGAIDKTT